MSSVNQDVQKNGSRTHDCKKTSMLDSRKSSMLSRTDSRNVTDVPMSDLLNSDPSTTLSKDTITPKMARSQAFRWCTDSLGGAWASLESAEEMGFKPLIGGTSNYLYLVSLPEGTKAARGEPSTVLLRIYGQISQSTLDFLVHNSVVFALLAEKGLGPKPYGMYHDGRVEEFINARPLTLHDLREVTMMTTLASKMCQFHSLDMPLCKRPRWFKSLVKGWLRDIQNQASPIMQQVLDMAPGFDLTDEFMALLDMANDLDCPVVFCHNDMQGGNVLLHEDCCVTKPQVTIIDFEYSHYNYREYDIANHFNEWMYDYSGGDGATYLHFPDMYPSKEQQMFFFRSYLEASGVEVNDTELVHMYRGVQTLALHSHFLWGVWSIVQAQTSTIEFDYKDYALSRFGEYFRQKEKLPSLLK